MCFILSIRDSLWRMNSLASPAVIFGGGFFRDWAAGPGGGGTGAGPLALEAAGCSVVAAFFGSLIYFWFRFVWDWAFHRRPEGTIRNGSATNRLTKATRVP